MTECYVKGMLKKFLSHLPMYLIIERGGCYCDDNLWWDTDQLHLLNARSGE